MKKKRARLIASNENPKSNKVFKIKIAFSSIIVIGFIYLAWYSYRTQVKNINEADLPLIKAPTSPLKIKPEDPGGLKINHKDKEIYDHISGKNINKLERVNDDYAEPSSLDQIKESITNSSDKVRKKLKAQKKVKPVILKIPPSNTKSYRKVIKPKKYWVRVAAIKSPSVKRQAWNVLKKKYPILKSYSYKITTIKSKNKYSHFIDAGSINNKSKANSICLAIKKAGGKCKIY